MSENPIFEQPKTDGALDKLARKTRESPLVPIGMAGFFGVAGYGIYKFKYRGSMSASQFLMQLRVAAQGTVVGILTLGIIYTMANDYLLKKDRTPAIANISEPKKN